MSATMLDWTQSSTFLQYGVLPLAIFAARIVDVSMGTVRVVLLGRGMRLLAPILGFFEIIIWLIAIGQIMQNLSNWVCYVAYGAGFAAGNYIGLIIEAKLAVGLSMVRIITPAGTDRLKRFLRRAGYRVTTLRASGRDGEVDLLFTVIRRRQLPRVVRVIRRYNPAAFYTIEDVRYASDTSPLRPGAPWRSSRRMQRMLTRRKHK